MQIEHNDANDYEAILQAMDKMLADDGSHGLGMILQICELMTQDCLEFVVQQASDRWTFETGKKEHEHLLELLESMLKQKREKKRNLHDSRS